VFNSASLSSLVNCTVVSGSTNAGFIINPTATATFTFTPSSTIAKEEVRFNAANSLVYSLGDSTASGSAFGVDLNYKRLKGVILKSYQNLAPPEIVRIFTG
jgi:hypothetical protein